MMYGPCISERWSGVSYMTEAFSLLAVATSLTGTLLGFLEFLKEQLKNLSRVSKATRTLQVTFFFPLLILPHSDYLSAQVLLSITLIISLAQNAKILQEPIGLGEWWERNKISFTAKAMAVAPTLVVSTIVPDAFSAATDIAVSPYKDAKQRRT